MQADRPELQSWLPASLLNTAPIPVAFHVYIPTYVGQIQGSFVYHFENEPNRQVVPVKGPEKDLIHK